MAFGLLKCYRSELQWEQVNLYSENANLVSRYAAYKALHDMEEARIREGKLTNCEITFLNARPLFYLGQTVCHNVFFIEEFFSAVFQLV